MATMKARNTTMSTELAMLNQCTFSGMALFILK
jgi:hypothetical protein